MVSAELAVSRISGWCPDASASVSASLSDLETGLRIAYPLNEGGLP